MRQQNSRGCLGVFFIIVILLIFGGVLWVNARPTSPMGAVLPTQAEPTSEVNPWQAVLREGFGDNSTPLPTVAIPTQQFVPPTVSIEEQGDPVAASNLGESRSFEVVVVATATRTAPTPTLIPDDAPITVQAVTSQPSEWRSPALIPPVSRDPLGRDHYWFYRPVDSNANNSALSSYSYGSDGLETNNPLRVHHGIDMPNPIGERVRAAGSGTVIWAADGRLEQTGIFQNSPAYGNVIMIQHDFSYQGQLLYTLYAHLSGALVEEGDYVEGGQVIGLIGDSGNVTGSHVHFEVRLGGDLYRDTVNPLLWMVPYVGHGLIAGRVVDSTDTLIQDMSITIRDRSNGLVIATTNSYVYQGTSFDVRSDPNWGENFVIGDVPVGRYDVIAIVEGRRIIRQIDVREGMTSFVEIAPPEPTQVPETDGQS